jgi:pyrroline-5-carboxylate reductase
MIIEPSFINKNLTIKLQVKMPIILSVKAPMTLARLENERQRVVIYRTLPNTMVTNNQ